MMTTREWLLADDPAGVGTAMITIRGRAPALPAHHRHFARSSVTSKDFADPLGKPPPGIIPVAVKLPESCLGFAC